MSVNEAYDKCWSAKLSEDSGCETTKAKKIGCKKHLKKGVMDAFHIWHIDLLLRESTLIF